METGWSAAIPAAITAISALIIRSGGKSDTSKLQKELDDAKDELKKANVTLARIDGEFTIFKAAYFKQNPVRDDRGPKKE